MSAATQMLAARAGLATEAIRTVAEQEGLDPGLLRREVAAGRAVIPANPRHAGLIPIGIGRCLRTKINANIGNSALSSGPEDEIAKLECAVQYGADTVMDLSTGERADEIRARIIAAATIPVGTVPIYQALSGAGDAEAVTAELLLEVIREQAEQGVDFMTVHAGILRDHLPAARTRLAGIVSRGGAILARWMARHREENPLYTRFDDLLAICREHDVTLSLGDGLRPGCLADASDDAQFAELEVLGELVRRCRAAGVQAMVEGPGHLPLDQIPMNMRREHELCEGAPFYVLGPVVTDCAPGYDHITSAIGATLAAFHGAAMLCYVTPKEHLGLPNLRDVREGVVAYKIAAHAADIALAKPGARDRDDAITRARVAFNWNLQFELALDPERARALFEESRREMRERCATAAAGAAPGDQSYCSMCGPQFCPMRMNQEAQAQRET